jgi:octopine/nopaline transport system permease protein
VEFEGDKIHPSVARRAMNMDLGFLVNTMQRLAAGLPTTLQLLAFGLAIGGALAFVMTWARRTFTFAELLARLYVFLFRGTPLLLQIFLIYYGLGQFAFVRESVFWPLLREPYWCAVLALALNTAAYEAEIFRGAMQAVPRTAIEAGMACGMSRLLLFRRIIFPIALRQGLPAYGNDMIAVAKATSLASIITILELTGIAYQIISETYRSVEVFLCVGSLYLLLNFSLTRLVAGLEFRLTPHLRPAIQSLAPIETKDAAAQ